LFLVFYRNAPVFWVFSPLVHRGFLSTADLAPGGLGAIKWDCWLVKTLNKALATGTWNLRAAAMDRNAAEWCSIVDCVDNEASSN